MQKKRHSFKGSLGFVMAAAGSAVGLGNIWRFPYLAARDGGGIFLAVYLVLALTFGFTLLTAEVAIGRMTKQSPLTAYGRIDKRFGFLGHLACIIPALIMPYYCVIGGWVLKYLFASAAEGNAATASEGYFVGFITGQWAPIIFFLIFLAANAVIIYRGVNKGIEAISKILMPALIVLVLVIAIFSLTLSYTDADGVTRTGLQGLKILVVPNLREVSAGEFFMVVVDAMGQLFYSLSIAMGIMIAYGSYMPDDANLAGSINQIEIFDTVIAFLAGMMIIPAVYTFIGAEGMKSQGTGLMFTTLPKVFSSMGAFGRVMAIMFFAMVLFAALTSSMSIMEAVVSSLMDRFGMSRAKAVAIETLVALAGGILVCLGYNLLYFELPLPNGATAQILDVLDYVSNNVLMPVVAIGTCILVGWVIGPDRIIEEVEKGGRRMGRKRLFKVMIKFVAPVLLVILFLRSVGIIRI